MSSFVPRDLEYSRRRAPDRELVLFYMHAARFATLWEISVATRIRPSRVMGIMLGRQGEYAKDLALVAQGAVRATPRRDALSFEITSLGDRVAADLLV